MKGTPVHEVFTHLGTPDTIIGIPIRRWLYLAIGVITGALVFIFSGQSEDTGLLIAIFWMIPFIILFVCPKVNDDWLEDVISYHLLWLKKEKVYVWQFSARRWDRLNTELTGNSIDESTSVEEPTGWWDDQSVG